MALKMDMIVKTFAILPSILSITIATSPNFIVVNNTLDLSYISQSSNFVHKGQFKVLPVSKKCIITKCHGSTQDNIGYHQYCFEQDCPYGHYHCLNDSGEIIHFCAELEDICDLRSMDVAVFNKNEPDSVGIYTVPCKNGYYQPNYHHGCFMPCAKDTSIGLLPTSMHNPTQLAYCLPEVGCNRFGQMIFELGSRYDDCTGQNQCLSSEDLLPDCSCDAGCPHVRQPVNNFSCLASVETVTPSTFITDDEVVTPTLILSSELDRDKDHVDEAQIRQTDSGDLDKQTYVVENHSGSNSTNGGMIAMIVLLSVIVVILVIAVVLWMKNRKKKRVLGSDSELKPLETGVGRSEKPSKPASSIVTNISAKNVKVVRGDNYNITYNGTGTGSDIQCTNSDTESPSTQGDEEHMALLKDIDQEKDSGSNPVHEDETGLKEVRTEQ